MRKILMALAGLTGIVIVACKSEIQLTSNVPAAVASVDITPTQVSVFKGKTLQLNAVLRDAAGGIVTGRAVSWSAADPTIATVSSTGVLRGVAAGRTNIRAAVETKSVETPADVMLMPVTSVAIAPLTPSVGVGGSVQFSATIRDADGTVLTDRSVTWTTSSASVATVSSSGLVAAVGPGTAQITASSETRSASTALTVNPPSPAPVATVAVSLNASNLHPAQTTQANATLRDASNNVLTGRTIAWSSTNTAVATVNGSGVVTAVSAGTANITATSEGRSGAAAVTVTVVAPAAVASVVVTLTSPLVAGTSAQAQTTLRDASNNVLTGRVVTWSSSNTAVATVNGSGLVTAVAAGSANVIATSEGITGTRALVVSAVTQPPPTGSGEPVFNAATQSLIVRDDFNGYASRSAMMSAYPVGRYTENVDLVPGRAGSAGAARLNYGVGGAYDILFGPETRLDRVGGWNGTLPQKAGPYTHFFFSTWFRFSAGADPAANNSSGIKGFMFWHNGPEVGGRYQNAINQLNEDGRTRGPRGANPDNAQSGFNLYKTPDGRAPLFSTIADGQWHRFTIELYAGGDPSGHKGERYWVDGTLIYDDIDLPIGQGTSADHYNYTYPVRHWMVFGNFVDENARSPFFTLDVDDWMAWTP